MARQSWWPACHYGRVVTAGTKCGWQISSISWRPHQRQQQWPITATAKLPASRDSGLLIWSARNLHPFDGVVWWDNDKSHRSVPIWSGRFGEPVLLVSLLLQRAVTACAKWLAELQHQLGGNTSAGSSSMMMPSSQPSVTTAARCSSDIAHKSPSVMFFWGLCC